MAQRVKIELEDDIDGTDGDETVVFGLDGKEYEIDLSSANASRLREALAPFVGHARTRTGRGRVRRNGSRATSGPSAGEIRDWAKGQGIEVSERGRISAEVREAYDAAH